MANPLDALLLKYQGGGPAAPIAGADPLDALISKYGGQAGPGKSELRSLLTPMPVPELPTAPTSGLTIAPMGGVPREGTTAEAAQLNPGASFADVAGQAGANLVPSAQRFGQDMLQVVTDPIGTGKTLLDALLQNTCNHYVSMCLNVADRSFKDHPAGSIAPAGFSRYGVFSNDAFTYRYKSCKGTGCKVVAPPCDPIKQQPQKHIQNFIQNFTSSYSAARGYTVPSYRPVVPAAPSGAGNCSRPIDYDACMRGAGCGVHGVWNANCDSFCRSQFC
jgi:hypothetical protein